MSLAEELIADLESDDGEEVYSDAEKSDMDTSSLGDDKESKTISTLTATSGDKSCKETRISSIAKLWKSEKLEKVLASTQALEDVANVSGVCADSSNSFAENQKYYGLILTSINIIVEIDNEVDIIHKFIRDMYSKKFPELESLVPMPMEYILTVSVLLHKALNVAKNFEELSPFLPQATIMIVSVSASTTQGKGISESEVSRIEEACKMAISLNESRIKITKYVESRMTFMAPNLSRVVGVTCAAKLIGLAGGLSALSKIPASNAQLIGRHQKTLMGFSSTSQLSHTGAIYQSPLVQLSPPDLRRKISRLVCNKAILAARIDTFYQSTDGSAGQNFVEEINKRVEKMQEPPPVKQIKALPAPLQPTSKKRGGRKYRKMKERYGLTDLRKDANRLNFGDVEEDAYQEDLGFSLGRINKSKDGRLRIAKANTKTNVKLSKSLQKTIQKQNLLGRHAGNLSTIGSSHSTHTGFSTAKPSFGSRSSVSRDGIAGTASIVAFTPFQGLEIINPNAAETLNQSNAKYFSNTSNFINLKDSIEH